MSDESKKIFGYGEEIEVFISDGENGEPITKKYRFTPVALEDLEKLQEKLDEFFEYAQQGQWNEKAINCAADILIFCLKKTHPNVNRETLKKEFSLGGIVKAVNIVTDMNDFLSEMEKLNKMATSTQLEQPTK